MKKISILLLPALVCAFFAASCSREEPALTAPVVVVVGDVVINEVFSRGVPGDLDWMEIYNPNSVPVDISGYKVYDTGGQSGAKPKKEFPAGTIVPAKGFAAITCDTTDASGFGISSGGEDLWLENAKGAVIDMVSMIAIPVATNSYGRNPDGGATWQILTTTTRAKANKP